MVNLGSFSLSPPPSPRCHPSSLPTMEWRPTQCPSPFLGDVGSSQSHSMEENAKGKEEQRGDPWNGRPRRCVIRTNHDFLSWLVLALSFTLITADYLPSTMATRTLANSRTTARWVEQQRVDYTAGQSTSQHVNRPYSTPVDEPPSFRAWSESDLILYPYLLQL